MQNDSKSSERIIEGMKQIAATVGVSVRTIYYLAKKTPIPVTKNGSNKQSTIKIAEKILKEWFSKVRNN